MWWLMRTSFWFLPTVYGLAAMISVAVIGMTDLAVIKHWEGPMPNMLLTSAEVAKDLYSALATAILTMTTISFSTIMVVLTTYSAQFSPRTLQDFMRSKSTHHVLGVYTFGFLFALLNLLLVGKEEQLIRPIFMVITAIFGLALFIYFIHMTSKRIQVNQLLKQIHTDGNRLIGDANKEKVYIESGTWNESVLKELDGVPNHIVYSQKSGYMQDVEWKALFKWAEKENVILQVHAQAGMFIVEGEPLITIAYLTSGEKDVRCKIDHIAKYVTVGAERTDIQDIEFTLEKLVEIALRAISPSVNDPHTAINCINRIGALLIKIGKSERDMRFIANKDKQLRVVRPNITFDQYLYKSFYQIKHYGKEDISVLTALLKTMAQIASVSGDEVRKHIWIYHYEVLDVFDWKALSNLDYLYMRSAYDYLLESCGKKRVD